MAQGKTTLGLKVTTNLAMNHPEAMAIQFWDTLHRKSFGFSVKLPIDRRRLGCSKLSKIDPDFLLLIPQFPFIGFNG
jgi:hypothetical protein